MVLWDPSSRHDSENDDERRAREEKEGIEAAPAVERRISIEETGYVLRRRGSLFVR